MPWDMKHLDHDTDPTVILQPHLQKSNLHNNTGEVWLMVILGKCSLQKYKNVLWNQNLLA